ncbi:hypothetical protein [Acinetobacter terrae]|uniref:hypothetical protein n=1 Tax=Acinetobacter terrae TaxID=2731247 RepID=UPI001BE3E880|nr:hypothetical protein [Acinetobacter terrae]
MKKEENLVATLLAVYAIILALCIAIYAIFKLLEVDITLATNLLIWSATIFAPIAVLMTYTNWREQKQAELLSEMSEDELHHINSLISKIDELEKKLRLLLCNNGITEEYKKGKIEFDNLSNKLEEFQRLSNFNRSKLNFFLKSGEKIIQANFFNNLYNYLNILVIESDPRMMELMVEVDNERMRQVSEELFDNLTKYKIILFEYIAFKDLKHLD